MTEKTAMNNETFKNLVDQIRTDKDEWYGAMELNKLEVAVRGHKVAPNKIYNYMSKDYIAYKLFGKTKRIHKDEVIRYLTQCRMINKSDFKERFKSFL